MATIKTTLTVIEEVELIETIENLINESIKYCPAEDRGFYETMTFEDYKNSLVEEIWNEDDEMIGEGINTIAHKFVINDETKAQIEGCFRQARDEAWAEYLEESED